MAAEAPRTPQDRRSDDEGTTTACPADSDTGRHMWLEVTAFGDRCRRWRCLGCGARWSSLPLLDEARWRRLATDLATIRAARRELRWWRRWRTAYRRGTHRP